MANRGHRLPKALPNREEGEPCRTFRSGIQTESVRGFRLAHSASATGRALDTASIVAALARFFPDAAPLRLPVQLARVHEAGEPANFSESTVIEFGTTREVLFASKTPLEFGDMLRVRNSDGSLDVEVSVVAVQYQPGKTVVAARFKGEVPNWIVKS